MIQVTKHTRDVLIQVAKQKKIYVEGSFLKILKAEDGDKEFQEYLNVCKQKDSTARRKRLEVTKQVQEQNKKLEEANVINASLVLELQNKVEEIEQAKRAAEKLRDDAVEDLEVMQKRTQYELIGTIVRVALFVIIGVGMITTVMYWVAIAAGHDTQIIGSTWSNMLGILLTNAFSIVGTIMGVKYATEKD